AAKKYKPEQIEQLDSAQISRALTEFRNTAFDDTLRHDEELAIAEITAKLLEAEEQLKKGEELSLGVEDTIKKINAAYDKLKDSAFGIQFTHFAAELPETGTALQISAAIA